MARTSDFKDWTDEDLQELAELLDGQDAEFIVGFFEELRGPVRRRPQRRH